MCSFCWWVDELRWPQLYISLLCTSLFYPSGIAMVAKTETQGKQVGKLKVSLAITQKLHTFIPTPSWRTCIIKVWVKYTAGKGNGTPLQYSCLENPMDGGAWWAAVHGVAKSRTRLSDFTFTFHFHALEKEMATHSSVLAWRIPGMGEPGGLPSLGSHRVRHDWSDLAAAASSYKAI